MTGNEFGPSIWISYALLGLVLTVGYAVLRIFRTRAAKKKREDKPEEPKSDLERQLQAELDAERRQREGKVEEGETALEPPREVQEELNELREKYLGKEQSGGDR